MSHNIMTLSHNPLLHIAPLPSTNSSDVSLLNDYDNLKPQAHISYGSHRRISITIITPGIIIFIAVAGLASALLVWLQSHHVEFHISRGDLYFQNAIVAIKRTRAPHKLDDGSLESDMTMYGLAMSAVSAQLVSLTIPFLLGLLGYQLALMWILAQEKEHLGSMPMAAQYSLLVKLYGSANLFSAYETVQYLKHGAADLWLHTTASTFIHLSMTPLSMELLPYTGTKINLTVCPGPELEYSLNDTDYYAACASNNVEIVTERLAVMRNSSSMSRPVMVNDMAVLVPATMPDNVDNLTFDSFGLITQYQPMVDCSLSKEDMLYCPFNPPYNTSQKDFLESGSGWIEMFHLTGNTTSPIGVYHLDSALNPFGACLALYWTNLLSNAGIPTDPLPDWYHMPYGLCYAYMSTCSMTAYNVSLSYSTLDGNNIYNFTDCPTLSNFNTTSALFAGLNTFIYGMNLVDYLKTTVASSLTLSTEAFYEVLSRNISYAVMGLASPLFECDMSTGGNTILLRSASRYPLAPLAAVLAILYTYAFLVLAITMSSVMLLSWEIMVTKNCRKEHRATAIELIQLCLMNLLASITEQFVDPVMSLQALCTHKFMDL
ncbi:hypothetical protein F5146DRAFT_1139467 [Armillaria mellea]|nr:hypothetical protein F5146DRAFT_1139467 [Armillaria mellea]